MNNNLITSLPSGLFSCLNSLNSLISLITFHYSITLFLSIIITLFMLSCSLHGMAFNSITFLPSGLLSGLNSLSVLSFPYILAFVTLLSSNQSLNFTSYLYQNFITSIPSGLLSGLNSLSDFFHLR